ncbi:XRE family transcriptional regulator [Kitasatospora sp. NPDC001175]|uniref:XRE family transcriptional regulator n=1 Tax=Kitasatospora sp. NPDC001175 TaxID=3157103 RepID=UPI003D00BA1C
MPPRPKPGSKADRESLRAEMLTAGAPLVAIAAEMRARFGLRPREAWRHAHGMTTQQAADAFNDIAGSRPGGGPAADASLVGKWEKWPGSSGRRPTLPVLAVLAELYGTDLDDLLDLDDRRALPDVDLRLLRHRADTPQDTPPQTPSTVTVPLSGPELVDVAARESAQWAQWAEASNIGNIALEQLQADTQYLAAAYLTEDPMLVLAQTRAMRDRVFGLLEGHQRPTQSRDLYVIAGYLCGLLAWMSSDLGYRAQAETHGRTAWLCAELADHPGRTAWLCAELADHPGRTAWLCAELADHPGLRGWVCSTRSKVSFWSGRLREAVQHAQRGAACRPPGTAAILLTCQEADAWAELGAHREAQSALQRAADAGDQELAQPANDDIGGLFSCASARHANYGASVHLRGGTAQAALAHADHGLAELARQSIRAYGTEAQLHITRAGALLLSGDTDEVAAAIAPVLALPGDHRTAPVLQRLRELASAAARSPMADSRGGLHLQGAVDVFCRESAAALALSPGAPTTAWITEHD